MGFTFTGSWVHDLDRYLTTDPREEEKPVCTCSNCEGGIFDGDTYYKIGNERFCSDCMDGFKETAEAEEWFGEEY